MLCQNGGAGATQKCLARPGAPANVVMLADERGSDETPMAQPPFM